MIKLRDKKLLFHPSRVGKTFMLQKKWDNLTCRECGCDLKLEEDNDFEAVKICPRCGKKHLLVKKVRRMD